MISYSENIENKSRLISRRMFILSSLKLFVFISIISRLVYLQISENIKYASLSDKNRFREWKIIPERGIIKDFFGEKLADNTQNYELHMTPEDVPDIETLFFRLSKIINFDQKKQRKIIKKLKKRKRWESVVISDNLTWSEFSRLNLFLHEMEGIKPVVAMRRKYSTDGSSSHVIGYVADTSINDLKNNAFLRDINISGLKTGKNGLEKTFNELITGNPGVQRFEVNAYGKKIKELEVVKGIEGKSFNTTIDQSIQKYASEALGDTSGSVSVMDIYTGDIVVLVSSPTFDANKFVHGISIKDWESLIKNEKKPLINKPLAGLYPPGSTIKPLVALSTLENDVMNTKKVVECRGSIELYGTTYHCWKEKGHGFMNMRSAIKQSCDVYFYEAARRLGIDRLSITVKKFGLGKKVLGKFNEEKTGVVPDTKWKLKNIGKGWVLGETLISGIGQGYFQTTPIQICLMMAQLANGGYEIKPRIIDDRYALQPIINAWRDKFTNKDNGISFDTPILKRLYKNKENIKFVLDALYGATNEPLGTSYSSRLIKPAYVYAGKTGTSQIRTITKEERKLKLKNKDLPYKKRDHALFMAFAPYKNPRYSISVVIEHGGSGSSGAAPIAKKVIKKVLERHELRKKYQLDLFQEA